MPSILRMLLVAAIIASASATPALAADSVSTIVGTWKLNLSRSRYEPGPPPRSLTRTYVATSRGLDLSYDGADAEGNRTVGTHIINLDGQFYPEPNAPDYDSAASERLDRFTIRTTQRKDGRIVATLTYVVAKDGKQMTLTKQGVDAKGAKFAIVAVYDRV